MSPLHNKIGQGEVLVGAEWRDTWSLVSGLGHPLRPLRHHLGILAGFCSTLFFFFYCGVNRPEGGKVTGAGQSVQTQELDSFLSFYLKETRVTSSPLCELLVTISDHWPDGEQKLRLS